MWYFYSHFGRQVSCRPLNYSADTTISLSSPAINLTIKSGSVADSLVVSASNIAVTLSSSTGGTFTLTSPQSLGSSRSGGPAGDSYSCSSGIQTATITQTSGSATYTLTPNGSACSGGGGGSGGGTVGVGAGQSGGGGSPPPPASQPPPAAVPASSTPPVVTAGLGTFVATSSIVNVASTTDLLHQLLALVGQVRTLSVGMLRQENHGNFTIGAKGKDVWALQVFLITNNIIAPTGPATTKLVNPTSYFGFITQGSLAEYQTSVSIAPPAGYFGPKTKTYLLSTYLPNGSSTTPIPPAPTTASSSQTSPSSTSTIQLFQKDLRWGRSSAAIAELQAFLAKNPAMYPEGNVSGYFDDATLSAVQRFQLKYNLAHDGDIFYGYAGPQTRAKLNALLEAGVAP